MTGGNGGGVDGGSVTAPLAVVLDLKNVVEIDYTVAAELHEFVIFFFLLDFMLELYKAGITKDENLSSIFTKGISRDID